MFKRRPVSRLLRASGSPRGAVYSTVTQTPETATAGGNGSRDANHRDQQPAPSVAQYLWKQALNAQRDEEDAIKRRRSAASVLVSKARQQTGDDSPWDGEEPIEVVVRRMLEDRYKPLRQAGLARPVQQPSLFAPVPEAASGSSSSNVWTDGPLHHRPWFVQPLSVHTAAPLNSPS